MVFILPPIPVQILLFPNTHYAISYDIFTLANEDDAPYGWHSYRSQIYRDIAGHLRACGFFRSQYSDWVRAEISSGWCWTSMLGLEENIAPPHKLSSTLKGLRMSRLDEYAVMDVTDDLVIGGVWNNRLRGPVPARLVQPAIAAGNMLQPLPVPPPAQGFVRPWGSRPGGADRAENFLQ
ncbi:hypothetical protein F5880DRAFT_1503251 [Lentinula raphanica]|nr:hypothetical protein F5880DRAFT_1503251 [Lentinula raphanica]